MTTLTFVVLMVLVPVTLQHGRMMRPVQRSSMWRMGYKTPPNYNDNELFCGGRQKIQEMGGLCGVCGDDYTAKHRENEAGGRYATGIIVERYPFPSSTIHATIEITALHKGYFEFRLCPHNNPKVPVSQDCLNEFQLPIAEANGEDPLKYFPERRGAIDLTLYVPTNMSCSQCVLQWRYRAGNSWGIGPDGKSCLGCGVQEEFRNCADISIGDTGRGQGERRNGGRGGRRNGGRGERRKDGRGERRRGGSGKRRGRGRGIATAVHDPPTSSPITATVAPPINKRPIKPVVERTRITLPKVEVTRPSRRWQPGVPVRPDLTREERDRLVIGGVWGETRTRGQKTKNHRDNTNITRSNRGRNINNERVRSRPVQGNGNTGRQRGDALANTNRRVTSLNNRRHRITESRRRQPGNPGARETNNTPRGANRSQSTRRSGNGGILGLSNPIAKLLQALKVWQERFHNLQKIARRLAIEASNIRNRQTVSPGRNTPQAFPLPGSAQAHDQQHHHSQAMFSETRSLSDISHAFPLDESTNNVQALTDMAHSFPLPDETDVHNVNDMAHAYPLQSETTTSSPNGLLGSITPQILDHEIKNSLYMTSKIRNLIHFFNFRNRARDMLEMSRNDPSGYSRFGHAHHSHNNVAYDYPLENTGTTDSTIQHNRQPENIAYDFPMSDMPQQPDSSTKKPEMGFKKRAPEVVQEKVKIYVNKYNRINPGSLDYATAKDSKKTHWFDKLLKKNNAKSLGSGKVQLSDKTVIKVPPQGTMFDQNSLKK